MEAWPQVREFLRPPVHGDRRARLTAATTHVVGLITDKQDCRGTLPEVIDQATEFVRRNRRIVPHMEGIRRIDVEEYPLPAVREAIENANPDQAMSQVRTLEQIQSESVFGERFLSILFGSFAALALLLASLGIYGVIAYSVSQRTQELGVRSALGASAGNLRTQVFVGGMRLAAIGLVIGVVGALALARVMSSFVFGISVYDPLTLAAVMLVLTCVAAVACFIPARRVTRIDPMAALRCQ